MLIEALSAEIAAGRVVLFAGAGISRPLGLPSWRELVDQMANDLDYDPEVLVTPDADYMQVAELHHLKIGCRDNLVSWMRRNWVIDKELLRASPVHRHIVELSFPLIYTTNYDHGLEAAFEHYSREYVKISSVLDVPGASHDFPHIVKFHGDLDLPETMVLTESDYFERLDFESPMDLKFRSDMLGRSILFIGYSMRDLNLRILLHRLQRTWRGHDEARPKSFVFLTRPDPVQEGVLAGRGVTPIVSDALNVEDALPEFMAALARRVG